MSKRIDIGRGFAAVMNHLPLYGLPRDSNFHPSASNRQIWPKMEEDGRKALTYLFWGPIVLAFFCIVMGTAAYLSAWLQGAY